MLDVNLFKTRRTNQPFLMFTSLKIWWYFFLRGILQRKRATWKI